MPAESQRTRLARRWLIGFALLTPAAVFAALPWLKQQTDFISWLVGISAATAVIAASFAVAIIGDRHMDEWNRKGAHFAAHWGWLVGAGLVVLLPTFAPFENLVVGAATHMNEQGMPASKSSRLLFLSGAMTLVFVQTIATLALRVGWNWWMSRASV